MKNLFGNQAQLFDYLLSIKKEDNTFSINWSDYARSINQRPIVVADWKLQLAKKGFISSVTINPGKGSLSVYRIDEKKEIGYLSFREPQTPILKRKKEQGFIYLIKSENKMKIGWSEFSPTIRMKALQTGNPETLSLISFIKGSQKAEKVLHQRFSHLNYRGEWFNESQEILDLFTSKDLQFLIEKLSE